MGEFKELALLCNLSGLSLALVCPARVSKRCGRCQPTCPGKTEPTLVFVDSHTMLCCQMGVKSLKNAARKSGIQLAVEAHAYERGSAWVRSESARRRCRSADENI